MDEPDDCPADFYDRYDLFSTDDMTVGEVDVPPQVKRPKGRRTVLALTQPGPVRLYSTQEMLYLPAPKWLIEGVLPEGGFSVLYGPPASLKSFLAVDLAMSAACGGQWQGRMIHGNNYVVYVSAEGGVGIGKRAAAWLKARCVEPKDASIAWIIEPVSVSDGMDGGDKLIERMEEVERVPTLIVVDTLARCFDGDENQQDDMNRFVRGIDRLRLTWDCAVMIVHHTRLDGERERGSTSLRGAADTMMTTIRKPLKRNTPELDDDGNVYRAPDGIVTDHLTLSCNKQKDSEDFSDVKLRMVTVRGASPNMDSCVIDTIQSRPEGRPTAETRDARGLVPGCATLLDLLTETPMNRARILSETSLPKGTLSRYLKLLIEGGWLIEEKGVYSGGGIGSETTG